MGRPLSRAPPEGGLLIPNSASSGTQSRLDNVSCRGAADFRSNRGALRVNPAKLRERRQQHVPAPKGCRRGVGKPLISWTNNLGFAAPLDECPPKFAAPRTRTRKCAAPLRRSSGYEAIVPNVRPSGIRQRSIWARRRTSSPPPSRFFGRRTSAPSFRWRRPQ